MSNTNNILIELGTEELPPKALLTLSNAFCDGVSVGLKELTIEAADIQSFAAPRRLALWLKGVPTRQEDQHVEKRGPAVQAAFDADGNPSKAAQGFAQGCGVTVDELDRMKTDKGEWLLFKSVQPGQATADLLPDVVMQALNQLPIPKRMRWGDNDAEFVRPVKWLVMMQDDTVIPANVLGVSSGRQTFGHRFHAPEAITLNHADDYANALSNAYVMVNFAERRDTIRSQVEQTASELHGQVVMDEALLDEVTALVEWPVAMHGKFDEEFLSVPQEALITTMQDNQKYFAVLDKDGNILPHFIFISNIESKDGTQVVEGNERVIRPRFADAKFFWDQDRKKPLSDRIDATKTIVFQKQLGTLFDKSQRVSVIASQIANTLDFNTTEVQRAAELSKCDLMTDMVYEFTDLQGIMGRYYAKHDNEPGEIAAALDEQYMPRQAGDELPKTHTGQVLALADRIDTLAGIYAIGQKPTGSKDPFGLRRAAFGVLRICIEKKLELDLQPVFDSAFDLLKALSTNTDASSDVMAYLFDRTRLKGFYADDNINIDTIDAVLALKITHPKDMDTRVRAVHAFRTLPEADALAAANKRIGNILKKLDTPVANDVNESLLVQDEEKALFADITKHSEVIKPLVAAGEYEKALSSLAALRPVVDAYFDNVMVMADDEQLKNNRLALLNQLSNTFLSIADLSQLQN